MYDCNKIFLYEIIENYKDAESQEEKDSIFKLFCSSIWSSDNQRRTYMKSVKFHVRKDLLHTELGQVFDMWSDIEYRHYKAMTKKENWCAIIRQKINNIYTRYFDKEVILDKEYMDILKTPKHLYYKWISGIDMKSENVIKTINDAMDQKEKVKSRLQTEKMSLAWKEYKKVIECFLKRCFDNCRRAEEYEDKTKITTRLDFLNEDHFYVGYICSTLEGEILKWQKKYYGIREHKKYTRCTQCGAMIEKTNNRIKYCKDCYRKINQKDAANRMRKYRKKKVTF